MAGSSLRIWLPHTYGSQVQAAANSVAKPFDPSRMRAAARLCMLIYDNFMTDSEFELLEAGSRCRQPSQPLTNPLVNHLTNLPIAL